MTIEPTRLAREEIHHRFLNTLTALHGLLRRDFAAFDDPDVREAVATFEGQLMAFAGVHRTLNASFDKGCIDVPNYFGRLCAQLCNAHLAPRGIHCEFSADPGEIGAEAAEKLGLIIAELINNCAKHAFLERRRGKVWVSLRRGDMGWRCVVKDNGRGIQPGRIGEGLRLIHDLARAIRADLTFHSDDTGAEASLRLADEDPVIAEAMGRARPRGYARPGGEHRCACG